jgi:hypothetical protein
VTARAAALCACRSAPLRMRLRAPAVLDLDAGTLGAPLVTPTTLATIDEHLPGAFGFRIKATASGALFLVLPQRDPTQPRFWCVVVVKCAPGGLVDSSETGWMGKRGLRREELAETMAAIRTNVDSWLAEPSQSQLRTWVLTSHPSTRDDGIGIEGLAGLQKTSDGSSRARSPKGTSRN